MKTILTILFLAFATLAMAFDLSWTPGAGGGPVESFRVYRKKATETTFTLLTTTIPTVQSHSDPDRTAGNCYRVTAANFVGESAPLEACANLPSSITIIILK